MRQTYNGKNLKPAVKPPKGVFRQIDVGGKRKVKIHKKTVYYHGGCRLIWQ
jgi:hypothetical protein